MNLLKLTDEFELGLEINKKRARLVVFKNGIENVCRKENTTLLERFAESGEGRLFKGRLRLNNYASGLGIEVKGDIIAIVKPNDFISFLEMAKAVEIQK